ncbi:MAG: hypothetical protein GWN84_13175, partial [Gammaproteobacteria bacterium]|nr:hypothetical protein [Gammaproteobacteria bacterium]NIR83781.1 hypothetical protein [Gammaproteobacteria bacterium]NIU05107.1 hypothetical protein [Gammaproteobacteria bacterium]NIV51944.1 hypothetical protein [Gammaproteobacteria bacterium]NIX86380.1 hypothetical protein [Gammaproteobacteria bacterium]
MKLYDRVTVHISTSAELGQEIRAHARSECMTVSDWISEAVHRHVFSLESGRNFVSDLRKQAARLLSKRLSFAEAESLCDRADLRARY